VIYLEGYIQTGIGIFVSVVLFLLGYRQTVGAKKERIRNANKEIEKILIRRVVNEDFQLSLPDIIRLIEGKARDFKVKVEDLYFEEQVLNSIYTRIVETDFITQDQRKEVLLKITPLLEAVEVDLEINETDIINATSYTQSSSRKHLYILSLIGILATGFGGLFTIYPLFGNESFEKEDVSILIITILASSLSIAFIAITKYFKEFQQEIPLSPQSKAIENAINFEKEVAKLLARFYANVRPSKSVNQDFDFWIEAGGNKFLIEVKAWKVPRSKRMIANVVARLHDAVISEGALEGIIVVQSHFSFESELLRDKKVQIVPIKELKQYISQKTIS
jgi:Restriction endonuclease